MDNKNVAERIKQECMSLLSNKVIFNNCSVEFLDKYRKLYNNKQVLAIVTNEELISTASLFLKNNHEGVSIRFNPNGSLSVDVYIRIFYGYSVPDVAYKIQENIKNGIAAMVDMKTTRVNVHVMGVDFENSDPTPVTA